MKIIDDYNHKVVETNVLIETWQYTLDFDDHSFDEINDEIYRSCLSNHIEWQRGNRYGTLQIINYIGNISFFGNTYDVRSNKFLTHLSGSEQFKKLLEEVQEMSRNIIFSYNSPSFVLGNIDFKSVNPSLMLIFNYFKKIILDWDRNHNLDSSLRKIITKPNSLYSFFYEEDGIDKVKKVDNNILKSILIKGENCINIENDFELKSLPLSKLLTSNQGVRYFPTRALVKKKKLLIDTPENRFVKYFLRFVSSFAFRLNNIDNLPSSVHEDKEKILSFCRKYLSSAFFRNINELTIVPINSTVLQSKSGYKEIYLHYIRSRFGIKHIFEEFEKNAITVGLKKISDLYEYWVFYKIAIAFLGNNIVIEQQEIIEEDDKILYGVCFTNGDRSVYYNYTESKGRNTAYSIPLRPDTTVVLKSSTGVSKFVFDAKYKVEQRGNRTDTIIKYNKPEDIHKMHAYKEAIKDVKISFAVYPGTEFIFYEKDITKPIRNEVSSIEMYEGVGAIPLIPGNEKHVAQLLQLINEIIKQNF